MFRTSVSETTFAFIEPCRSRGGRPAVRRRVPAVGGVVGGPEQLALSERRIDFGGCGGPEPAAGVDVDHEPAAPAAVGDPPSPLRHEPSSSRPGESAETSTAAGSGAQGRSGAGGVGALCA